METEEPRKKKKRRRDENQYVNLKGLKIPITPRDITIIKWAIGIFIAITAIMVLFEDDTTEDAYTDDTEITGEDGYSEEYGDDTYDMSESGEEVPADEEVLDEEEVPAEEGTEEGYEDTAEEVTE